MTRIHSHRPREACNVRCLNTPGDTFESTWLMRASVHDHAPDPSIACDPDRCGDSWLRIPGPARFADLHRLVPRGGNG